MDFAPVGSVGCVAQVWHVFQSSTNRLALSPGFPAQRSNSGDEVRFVLPDRLLSATVCVEAKAVSGMRNLHVSISALGEPMVWQARLVLGFK